MAIPRTSHSCHIIGDPTHALMARKEILIKFSSIGKSVSEFIWAANQETLTFIIFEPHLVLALLMILSWFTLYAIYIPLSALYCNSRFPFTKDPYCSSYQVLVWKKIRKCHRMQLPVATIVPSVMFFVLSVKAKELKNFDHCSMVIAPFQRARESLLCTPLLIPSTVGKVFYCCSLSN